MKGDRKRRREGVLPDGSWLSHIDASDDDRLRRRNGIPVRVTEWTHTDPTRPGCGQTHRLITSVLDPTEPAAAEAVAVSHERWEQELVFDEWKTHLLAGRDPTRRSQTPRGVVPEVYGLAVAHGLVRRVMAEAAEGVKEDPDRLSFVDTVRVVQCRRPEAVAQPAGEWYAGLLREVGRQRVRARRERWYPRVMKRPAKKWPPKRPHHHHPPQPTQPFRMTVVIT